jgi:hypothetical protein
MDHTEDENRNDAMRYVEASEDFTCGTYFVADGKVPLCFPMVPYGSSQAKRERIIKDVKIRMPQLHIPAALALVRQESCDPCSLVLGVALSMAHPIQFAHNNSTTITSEVS